MTLREWKKLYDVSTHPYGTGRPLNEQAIMVFTDDYRDHADAGWDLHHLSDYVVSASVSGPAKVLVPRSDFKSHRRHR